MISRTNETVIKEIVTWSCDHPGCDSSTTSNRGFCGVAQIMTCDFCGLHFCETHRRHGWSIKDQDHKYVSCLFPKCMSELEDTIEKYDEATDED